MLDHYGFCPTCEDVFVFGCIGPFLCPKEHDTLYINDTEYYKYRNNDIPQKEIELFSFRKSKNSDFVRCHFTHQEAQEKQKELLKKIDPKNL